MGMTKLRNLVSFQKFIGRKCQWFSSRSSNYSAFYPLDWISLDSYIKIKNPLFLRTIIVMKDELIYRRILANRAKMYCYDDAAGTRNV